MVEEELGDEGLERAVALEATEFFREGPDSFDGGLARFLWNVSNALPILSLVDLPLFDDICL